MTEHVASRTLVKSPPELWAECSDAASLARHLDQFGEIRITRLDPETAVAWEGERARGTVRIEPAGWGTKVILTAIEVAGKVSPEVAEAEVKVPEAVEGVPALEVVEVEVEPEPPPELAEPEVHDVAVVDADAGEPDVAADPPARRRRFARLRGFLRGPEPAAIEPEALVPDASADAPEPSPAAEPAPEPVLARRRPRPRVAQATAPETPATTPEPPATTLESPARTLESPATTPEPPATAPEPPATEAALTAALDSLGQAHHRPYSRA